MPTPGNARSSSRERGPNGALHIHMAGPRQNGASVSPSSAAPTAALPAVLNAEQLLAAHAGDPLAALDQAVGERNTLSTQNQQLWKLIEKQRAGYNQIMKELERVRGERDAYRARLVTLNEPVQELRKAALKSSTSNPGSTSGRDTPSSMGSNKPQLTRHQSEDTAASSPVEPRRTMFRHDSDQQVPTRTPVSRAQDAMGPRERQLSLDAPRQSSLDSHSRPLPTVGEHPPRERHVSEGSRSALSEASAASSSSEQAMRMSPPPLVIPHLNIPAGGVRPLNFSKGTTPATATSSMSFVGASPMTATSSLMGASPMTATSVSQFPMPPSADAEPQAQPVPQSLMPGLHPAQSLAPIADPHRAGRDSSITLPDEARRYITNMVDSPMPSPAADQQEFNAAQQVSPPPPSANGYTAAPAISSGLTLSPINSGIAYDDEEEAADDMSMKESGLAPSPFLDMDEDDRSVGESVQAEGREEAPRESGEMYGSREEPPRESGEMYGSPESADSRAELYAPAPSMQMQSAGASFHSRGSSLSQTPAPAQGRKRSPERQATFRALPLVPQDLPGTRVQVLQSAIRPNERGKEVLSFVVEVVPKGKEGWKVEKLYSDVLGLDHRVRTTVGKSASKRIATLPEGKLWRDHAPAKADLRKHALEAYLSSLVNLPVKNKDEIIAFFTSDMLRPMQKPVAHAGYKEGYLTKRGRNFGGWKSRYFVVQGPVLEYYESRGGGHLGSIAVTGAQIGRQQRTGDRRETDDDNEYRHAFLIIESRKLPNGQHPRHVLCAESDAERDSWVEVLVRYVLGSYNDEGAAPPPSGPSPINPFLSENDPPRTSSSSMSPSTEDLSTPTSRRPPVRGASRDDIVIGGAVPISQLPADAHAKLMQAAPYPAALTQGGPQPNGQSPVERYGGTTLAQRGLEMPSAGAEGSASSSLPEASPLEEAQPAARAPSVQGNYADLGGRPSPEDGRRRERKSLHPSLQTVAASPLAPPAERPATPESTPMKSKGRLGGGFKFGSKETPQQDGLAPPSSADRREKAKSRTFWGFSNKNGATPEKQQQPAVTYTGRPVFGITIEEALDVVEIGGLPAIVFRCIQYLETKKAETEEGIYRLSGSSAVIKALKDRYNTEGDVDLLASDEFWDPHAIAGLLKSYFRELPASILTRDLHLRFLAVMDFVDLKDRVAELRRLISKLPIANYSLLRALCAHLILIIQNAPTNKMTMRNVGIVFSPTLGIPAGVFGLMLGEFAKVFNVDGEEDEEEEEVEVEPPSPDYEEDDGIRTPAPGDPTAGGHRNSHQYSDNAADKLLGLSGRSLPAAGDSDSEDGESISIHDDSETDTNEDMTVESTTSSRPTESIASSRPVYESHLHPTDSPDAGSRSKATAAGRGLSIAIGPGPGPDRSRRQSRMVGLPTSPRPGHSMSPHSMRPPPSPTSAPEATAVPS